MINYVYAHVVQWIEFQIPILKVGGPTPPVCAIFIKEIYYEKVIYLPLDRRGGAH